MSAKVKRQVRIYRAFTVSGIVHGGGCSILGEWRKSYRAAMADFKEPKFKASYGDSYCGVEVREEI